MLAQRNFIGRGSRLLALSRQLLEMNAGFRVRPAGRVAERRRRRAGFETEIDSAIWTEAARAAIAFRESAGADRRISTAFRTMCKENTKPLRTIT